MRLLLQAQAIPDRPGPCSRVPSRCSGTDEADRVGQREESRRAGRRAIRCMARPSMTDRDKRAHSMDGMGKVHFPATTTKPEAQAFIDQGVAQLHSFYYYESERSFRQAALLDPDCAMAYWGMAMSNVNNDRRAKGFVKEAPQARRQALRNERPTTSRPSRPSTRRGNDSKTRKKNHLLGLETVVQEFPDDINARAWLAMVTWQNASSDGIGSRQAVDTLLDTVFQVGSMHPGAHHYRIHLWDNVKPARAEKSAGLFAPSAPGIAHAWHMPGHTYTGLKRYADAAYQQEGSAGSITRRCSANGPCRSRSTTTPTTISGWRPA